MLIYFFNWRVVNRFSPDWFAAEERAPYPPIRAQWRGAPVVQARLDQTQQLLPGLMHLLPWVPQDREKGMRRRFKKLCAIRNCGGGASDSSLISANLRRRTA